MKVYIDFDDVLCETAKHFTKLAKELFGIDVPYREVQFFNLKKTIEYGESMKAKSLINTGDYQFKQTDKIVTLSTCTGDSSTRFVVQGVRVEPE